jgi:hypothetical protein
MVNSCAVCGCCTRTDIVREHLEDTLRICDVSAKGLYPLWLCPPLTCERVCSGNEIGKVVDIYFDISQRKVRIFEGKFL